jgi:hypothetical protein
LQTNQVLTSLACILTTQFQPKEPWISLLDKFDGTLLSSMALVWFTPLLKHQSLLFNDFETFIDEFNATFGDFDKNAHLTSKYNLFVTFNCGIYIGIQTISLQYFMG